MSNFAILRIQKLKNNSADLAGLQAHNQREHAVNNADPERAHLNRTLAGDDSVSLKNAIDNRIEEGHTYTTKRGATRKIRSDACRGVEMVLTGSPIHMASINIDEWVDRNMEFLNDTYGEENVVKAHLHMDEKTPHIHATIVPIAQTDRGGVLSHKHFFDGKKMLSQLQTDYAKAMEPMGFERGKVESRAEHTEIADFYKSVNNQEVKEEDLNIGAMEYATGKYKERFKGYLEDAKKMESFSHQLENLEKWKERQKNYHKDLWKGRVQAKERTIENLEEQIKILQGEVEQRDQKVEKQSNKTRWWIDQHVNFKKAIEEDFRRFVHAQLKEEKIQIAKEIQEKYKIDLFRKPKQQGRDNGIRM
jgi:hypothetical protein